MFDLRRYAATALITLIASVAACQLFAQDNPHVDSDSRLPTGGGSPEAAACDMVRVLVRRDFQSFAEARPESGGGGDTQNDVADHYVSLVTDTTFRCAAGVVTAHELLRSARLTVKRASAPVAIDEFLLRPYQVWTFGSYKKHSHVDVTVSDRDGTEFTTRMIVVYVEKQGVWKAYPIREGIAPLYQQIDNLSAKGAF